jgi:O-antigen ligase
MKAADLLAILMATSLPWSTTIFGIFTVLWLTMLATTVDIRQFGETIRRPQSAIPVILVILAIVGMAWSDASWATRMHVTGSMVKLLALPLLIYQFERSESGIRIFLAFLASCTILLALSWLNWFDPRTILFSVRVVGVPVKNWITQGVEFVLCIFGAAGLAIVMWRKQRRYAALGFGALAFSFLLNLAFVASSRTSLVAIPVLLLISTFRYMGWRHSLVLYAAAAVIIGVITLASPKMRERLGSLWQQYTWYERDGGLASVGLRLEYWTKSLTFIRAAPLIGHGTGSIHDLFERDAAGKSLSAAEIVANPHNQTLYFAIEWGAIGVILLYAMWITHFLMFTETRWISWLGVIVVSQNVFDSLFNSHLSDYVEGWIYVLGVGIAAGMVSKFRKPPQLSLPPRDAPRGVESSRCG